MNALHIEDPRTSGRDDDMVGKIVLVVPRMQMVEVFIASRLMDVAVCHTLNMEGERTGRTGMFKLSRMVRA